MDGETGYQYHGARYYNEELARYMSVDRYAMKFFHQSPYVYAGNMPINYLDVNGDSIGITESFLNDPAKMKAMEEYVNSKEGREFLAQYAQKGQTIAGHTFTEDGKYHLKGINLFFNRVNDEKWEKDDTGNLVNKGTSGGGRTKSSFETTVENVNGEHIHKVSQVNIYVTMYSGKGWQTDNYTFNSIITLFHETFIHVNLHTEDFLDDGLLNRSNISQEDRERANGEPEHFQHKHILNNVDQGKSNPKSLWPNQAFNAFKSISKDWNLNYSDKYIWEAMWKFSGSYNY